MADEYATIRVPQDAFEEAKAQKEDTGQTWAEYLTDESRGVDAESVAEELRVSLDLDTTDATDELRDLQSLVAETSGSVTRLEERLTDTSPSESSMTVVPVEEVREQLDTDAPNFDDVQNACEKALENKLPDGVTNR